MDLLRVGPSTNTNIDDDSEPDTPPPSTEEFDGLPSNEESSDNYTANLESSHIVTNYSQDPEELREYEFEAADFDDEDDMDIWNDQSRQIRLGMYFRDMEELMGAVRQ
ncbi:hypothetical protein L1987_53857 [Smallanthus sonchifolius]|uniref:Uncharacterized protein n=1 Tax=Smallanthus sonchifolius TaxID=185202 RepID=A0ACB9EXP6_9ASTR|nr:hypothetical protein L1987_53857 [Smallanthus sonchifolius]